MSFLEDQGTAPAKIPPFPGVKTQTINQGAGVAPVPTVPIPVPSPTPPSPTSGMGLIRQLRLAGFPDDQINATVTKARQTMIAAGISRDEQNKYILGFSLPENPPVPFLNRIYNGMQLSAVLKALNKGPTASFDPTTQDFSLEEQKFLRDFGIWPSNSATSALRFTSDATKSPLSLDLKNIASGLPLVYNSVSTPVPSLFSPGPGGVGIATLKPAPLPDPFTAAGHALWDTINEFANSLTAMTGGKINIDKQPAPSPESAPPTWSDVLDHPENLLPKITYQIVHGAPEMAAFAAAQLTPTGKVGSFALGVTAAGVTAAVHSLGSYFQEEVTKQQAKGPVNYDVALDNAVARAAQEGIFTAAGFAAFAIMPFKSVVKNVLLQALGVQQVVGAAQTEITGLEEGKTQAQIAGDIGTGSLGTAIGTALPAALIHLISKSKPAEVRDLAAIAAQLQNGSEFSGTRIAAPGVLTDQPIGRLPSPESVDDAAKVIGGDDHPAELPSKLTEIYKEQGITPAEVKTDATTDVTIKQDLLSLNKPTPDAYHSPAIPRTLVPEVDSVLNRPDVSQAIITPKIDRTFDVPYGAGASNDGTTVYVDKSIPLRVELDGVVFDPAIPVNIHEQVERVVMEELLAQGVEQERAYLTAHHDYAEVAERAWVEQHGIDWKEYQDKWQEWLAKTENENPANPPKDLYLKPYPHDVEELLARRSGEVVPRVVVPSETASKETVGSSTNAPELPPEVVSAVTEYRKGLDGVAPDVANELASTYQAILTEYHRELVILETMRKDRPAGELDRIDKLLTDQFATWRDEELAKLEEIRKDAIAPPSAETPAVESPASRAIALRNEIAAHGGGGGAGSEPPTGSTTGGGEEPLRITDQGGKTFDEADADIQKSMSKLGEEAKTPRRTLADQFARLNTAVNDGLYPILRAGLVKAYQAFRFLNGTMDRITSFVQHGAIDFNTLKIIGPGLREILAPMRTRGELFGRRSFSNFISGVRAIELAARKIEPGIPRDSLAMYAQEAKAEFGEEKFTRYATAFHQLMTFQDQVLQYVHDSGVLTPTMLDRIRELNKAYVPWFRLFPKKYLMGRGPRSYVAQNPIKVIEGGTAKRMNPLEAILKNIHLLVTVADRNDARRTLVDEFQNFATAHGLPSGTKNVPAIIPDARQLSNVRAVIEQHNGPKLDSSFDGLLDNITLATRANYQPGHISYFRDGVHTTVDVGEDIANAVDGLDRDTMNWAVRILRPTASLLRAGDVLSLAFAMRHLARETRYGLATWSGEGIFTPYDLGRGLLAPFIKSEKYLTALRSGAGMNSTVNLDRKFMGEHMSELRTRSGNIWNGIRHPVSSFTYPIRLLTNAVMGASHYGAFLKRFDQLPIDSEGPTKEQLLDAAWKARSISVDPMNMGSQVRGWNLGSAFFSVTVKDPARMIEAAIENPARLAFALTLGTVIPTAVSWAINHNNPRYKDLPTWDKFVGIPIIIPTGSGPNDYAVISLANGWGAQLLVHGAVLSALNALNRDDNFGKELLDTLQVTSQATTPGLVPNLLLNLLSTLGNFDTFTGSPIIPKSVEGRLPAYRFTANTTELSKAISQIIESIPGADAVSSTSALFGVPLGIATQPAMLDYTIKAFTGNLGTALYKTLDWGLRSAGVIANPTKPPMQLKDIPFIGGLVQAWPSASFQPITDFYNKVDHITQVQTTINDLIKVRDIPAATKLLKEVEANQPGALVKVSGGLTAMNNISRSIQQIYNLPMTEQEKRQQIDQLYSLMITTAKQLNSVIDGIDAALQERGQSK